jgi:hypothetical protein
VKNRKQAEQQEKPRPRVMTRQVKALKDLKKTRKSRRRRKKISSRCKGETDPRLKSTSACTVSSVSVGDHLYLILILAPPEPKTTDKYSKEDKAQMEIVRRWKVVIEDIEIVNQGSHIINPFL